MEILDSTKRHGEYYTNWGFELETVKIYLDSINNLPFEYIELSYLNPMDKNEKAALKNFT